MGKGYDVAKFKDNKFGFSSRLDNFLKLKAAPLISPKVLFSCGFIETLSLCIFLN